MLVLSRKKDEKIIMWWQDQKVEITMVRIDPNKVRVGIEAPSDVIIIRSELENKFTRETLEI